MGDALPTMVLDAGTGFTRLRDVLGGEPFRGTVLLTHLHWDHTQGLPFLPNADRPDAQVSLRLPAPPDGMPAEALLARAMSPPHFPIRPSELRGSWTFDGIEPGTFEVEGYRVTAAEVAHKGGRTYGYRVEGDTGSFCYLPDHAPAIATPELLASARQLADGVDVLFHDSQFWGEGERPIADLFGHATVDDAIGLAASAHVGRLVLIHHAPIRTDAQLDALVLPAATIPVTIGREGDEVPIGLSG